MKCPRFVTLTVAMLGAFAATAGAQDLETARLDDAVWMKAAGDRLARCAGTYRGAAEVMRQGGREQAATYADGVASGALFAAYIALTSPAVLEANALETVDPNVHIEALAWGTKRNFMMAAAESDRAQGDAALPDVLRACTQIGDLQSSILRTLAEPATPVAADARGASKR